MRRPRARLLRANPHRFARLRDPSGHRRLRHQSGRPLRSRLRRSPPPLRRLAQALRSARRYRLRLLRRTGRPRPHPLYAPRTRHPRRLADVAAAARDLSGPRAERRVQPVPAPPEARAGARHAPLSPDCARSPARSKTAVATSAPSSRRAIYVDRAMRQAKAGARYLGEVLRQRGRGSQSCGASSPIGAASPPAQWKSTPTTSKACCRKASGEWAIGQERYTRLLREKELLPYDAHGLRERGTREYDRLAERATPLRPGDRAHR